MERIRKLLSAQIGLFHFESCINVTNVEQIIVAKYDLMIKDIQYDKIKTLSSDFYDSNSETSLFHHFQNALRYTNHHREAYSDIKKIMFEIIDCFVQIVLHCNKITISIEALLVNFISFYECLMQDYDYERTAYEILQSLNDYQAKNIFFPLERIAEQPQCIKSTIEKVVSKYIPLQEQLETTLAHIKNLHKPMFLLQTSLPELSKAHANESYERVKEAIRGRFMMHTVKEKNSKSWGNHETRKLFLEYYSNLLALCLSCKDVKGVFEDLLINFQSLIHEI